VPFVAEAPDSCLAASPHLRIVAVMAPVIGRGACISVLSSGDGLVKLFGIAAPLSLPVSYAICTQWLVSVWASSPLC
jgi:hypothetical protein